MMQLNSGGEAESQQSSQTLFDDICKLQTLIKHESNLSSHCKLAVLILMALYNLHYKDINVHKNIS